MQLILYPLIIFMIAFLVQLIFIFKRGKNKSENISIYEQNRKNMKIIIKVLIALIISVIIGVISFYVLGIAVIAGLRAGH